MTETETETKNLLYTTDVDLISLYNNSEKGLRKSRFKDMLARFQHENMLNEGELFLKTRNKRLVRLRWEFFYQMKNELGYSFSDIGRIFNLDHTTVMHGYKSYEAENGLGRQDT